MDELDKKIEAAFSYTLVDGELNTSVDVQAVKQAFHDDGYIKLPGNAQNVTITTSDNTHDGVLMTEQEWREKFNG